MGGNGFRPIDENAGDWKSSIQKSTAQYSTGKYRRLDPFLFALGWIGLAPRESSEWRLKEAETCAV
jgi:hypothetical protein